MFKWFITTALFLAAAAGVGAQPAASRGFIEFVAGRVERSPRGASTTVDKTAILRICPIDTSVLARRVFAEYGSLFAATDRVSVPPTCIFANEAAVSSFRSTVEIRQLTIDGVNLLLQKDAAESLSRVLAEAASQGISITPLDGSIAAGRTFFETERIWNSRFEPALAYWSRRGAISQEEAAAIRSMKLDKQVEKVIEWESKGYWFGTGRTGSIFSSTAPPGTSQHISLLAFDVAPPLTPAKRAMLNAHGWFQTVQNDPGHFTYLGVAESELPKRGLKAVMSGSVMYWVPNLITETQP